MKPSLPVSIDLRRTSVEFQNRMKQLIARNLTPTSNSTTSSLHNLDDTNTETNLLDQSQEMATEQDMTETPDREVNKVEPHSSHLYRRLSQETHNSQASAFKNNQSVATCNNNETTLKIRHQLPIPVVPEKTRYSGLNITHNGQCFIYKVNKETQTESLFRGDEDINYIINFLQDNGISRETLQSMIETDGNNNSTDHNHNNRNNQAELNIYNPRNRISEELRQEIQKKSDENKKKLFNNNAALIMAQSNDSSFEIANYKLGQKSVSLNRFSGNTKVNNTVRVSNVDMEILSSNETFESTGSSKIQKTVHPINKEQPQIESQLRHIRHHYQRRHEYLMQRQYMSSTSRDPRLAAHDMQPPLRSADSFRNMKAVFTDDPRSSTPHPTANNESDDKQMNTMTPSEFPGRHPQLPPWRQGANRHVQRSSPLQTQTQRSYQGNRPAQYRFYQQQLTYKQMEEEWNYQKRNEN